MSAVRRLNDRDGEFGDGSTAYEVAVPVNLAALEDEIRVGHGWRNGPGLVAEGDLSQATSQAPVVLWVTRADADVRTVKRAVSAHQGVEDDVEDDLAVLRDKAAAGEDLTDDEMQVAVRLLLTRG